ncbi:MAG: DUF1800 family protein, partial [Planctomycetota bacterium]
MLDLRRLRALVPLACTAFGLAAHSAHAQRTGPPPLDAAGASRFLTRATFGPRPQDIDHLLQIGPEAWIDQQLGLAPRLEFGPALQALDCSSFDLVAGACPEEVVIEQLAAFDRLWWRQALWGRDQLRQRVAFALSEIFVVSRKEKFIYVYPRLVAGFHEQLLSGAFGDFRDLLEDVTRGPAMGTYLSLIQNRAADPVLGTHPDENFAREVMQLFTIGLNELEPTGQPRLDGSGDTIPTYDQSTVQELARVLTGYNHSAGLFQQIGVGPLAAFLAVLPGYGQNTVWPAFHDSEAKVLPDGSLAPAGLFPLAELDLALDALANHPNVGPFIGKQLSQRLVSSNPSDAYVARISAVWDDDGSGRRGHLGAVVKAILLDPEADLGWTDAGAGKVREPILRATALWRALEAKPTGAPTDFPGPEVFGQRAYDAPSVFNFFPPDHSTPQLNALGLVAPELRISDHTTLVLTLDFLGAMIAEDTSQAGTLDPQTGEAWGLPRLDLSPLLAVAADHAALIDAIDLLLLGGTLSPKLRTVLTTYLSVLPD